MRRPSDPTGRTVLPSLSLRRPEDLLALLPQRLPRFKPGDQPLPGVDWQLVELLGTGGFGEVWKATNPHMPSAPAVALKFCLDPQAAKTLRHEAAVLDRVMRQGNHPGFVQLLRTYLSADPPCLEYEFVGGGDLAAFIREAHQKGPVKPDRAARWVQHLASQVAFAHRLDPPLVHRDLTPANILIQRGANNAATMRIADFGISGLAASRAIGEARRGVSSRGQSWRRRPAEPTRRIMRLRSRCAAKAPTRETTCSPSASSGIRCSRAISAPGGPAAVGGGN